MFLIQFKLVSATGIFLYRTFISGHSQIGQEMSEGAAIRENNEKIASEASRRDGRSVPLARLAGKEIWIIGETLQIAGRRWLLRTRRAVQSVVSPRASSSDHLILTPSWQLILYNQLIVSDLLSGRFLPFLYSRRDSRVLARRLYYWHGVFICGSLCFSVSFFMCRTTAVKIN